MWGEKRGPFWLFQWWQLLQLIAFIQHNVCNSSRCTVAALRGASERERLQQRSFRADFLSDPKKPWKQFNFPSKIQLCGLWVNFQRTYWRNYLFIIFSLTKMNPRTVSFCFLNSHMMQLETEEQYLIFIKPIVRIRPVDPWSQEECPGLLIEGAGSQHRRHTCQESGD